MLTTKKFKRSLRRSLPYILILLVVTAALSTQMFHSYFINGVDTFFHMEVTYDAYQQIKHFNFSYFLSMFGFNHSLRIVNAIYGPLAGYVSGLILLVTGSWIHYEIMVLFIVLTVAGISMYQLCKYWRVNTMFSIIIGCLYMFSFSIDALWINSQYDGLGAAFIPWVVCLGSKIINHDRFTIWKAALLLLVIMEVHIFSIVLVVMVLGLSFIMGMFTGGHRLHLLYRMVKLALITLLFSANSWAGILDVLTSNGHRFIPTFFVNNMNKGPWDSVGINGNFPFSYNLMPVGIYFTVLMLVIVVAYWILRKRLSPQLDFVMLVLGVGFLWLSSRLFPWVILQKAFPVLDTDLQFPKRFLPVSTVAFLLILGVLMTYLYRHVWYLWRFYVLAVVFLCGFAGCMYHTIYVQNQSFEKERTSFNFYHDLHDRTHINWLVKPTDHNVRLLMASLHGRDLGLYFRLVNKSIIDYLPTDRKIKSNAQYLRVTGLGTYPKQIINYRGPKLHYRLDHHVMTATFNARNRRSLILPLVKYAHTSVVMNGRKLVRPNITSIGALDVKPKDGHNVLKIRYRPGIWYRFLISLSLVCWIMLITMWVMQNFKLLDVKSLIGRDVNEPQ